MTAWLATPLLLVCVFTACSATTSYGYGYVHGYGYGYGYGHDQGGNHDPRTGLAMSVTAHFETGGVRGTICFTQEFPGASVIITVRLYGLEEQFAPQEFDWNIHEYPVGFSEYPDFPCSNSELGGIYEPASCPIEPRPGHRGVPICYGNLGERHGLLKATSEPQVFTDNVLDLFGPYSPIGRSVVLRDTVRRNNPFTCANIEYQGITLQTLRAGFGSNLNGDVIFRRQEGRSGTTLQVDLFTACNATEPFIDGPPLGWYLRTGTCDNIGPVFGNDTDPEEIKHGAFDDCSRENPRACPGGALSIKCGVIRAQPVSGGFRYMAFCNDDQLGLFALSQIQETVIVFHGPDGRVVDCQPWNPINQLCARVNCDKRPRIHMDILFFQRDPVDRTHVRTYITGLDGEKAYLQVRRDAVTDRNECAAGGLFDKGGRTGVNRFHGGAAGVYPTGDVLPVGTLEFKTTSLRDQYSVIKQDTTSWLPLFGPFSIIGRSLALVDLEGNTVTCCNIMPVLDPSPELIRSILGYQEETPRG